MTQVHWGSVAPEDNYTVSGRQKRTLSALMAPKSSLGLSRGEKSGRSGRAEQPFDPAKLPLASVLITRPDISKKQRVDQGGEKAVTLIDISRDQGVNISILGTSQLNGVDSVRVGEDVWTEKRVYLFPILGSNLKLQQRSYPEGILDLDKVWCN
ncbi:hypothetical protein RRG08_064123 [Elysia crispata]|uniref:Uncharacterized protein n=1 Tax=Elysia crispata TaxID=231223 RepID=A0AAE1DYW5_9GAST|nr:hypothetical protein RRG08_064123 [Elysia crispata]